MYIKNLEGGLQKDGMKLYEEERCFEEPTLNKLNHVYELYKESGSETKNIEEIGKGENKKNAKESSYTNMDEGKEGEQADPQKRGKPRNRHEILKKRGK